MYSNIKEIKTVATEELVNELLSNGWVLLEINNSSIFKFIVGRADSSKGSTSNGFKANPALNYCQREYAEDEMEELFEQF